uniref:Uncharacterized protein n=1 Tax=Atrato Nege-like virus 1 TaxID=2689368 RepID=A0A6B9KLD1_9VIRU|nr:hypothetical protein [Atrato Nege-like virus 1]
MIVFTAFLLVAVVSGDPDLIQTDDFGSIRFGHKVIDLIVPNAVSQHSLWQSPTRALWRLKEYSTVYKSDLLTDIQVRKAGVWGKMVGYHCPPNYHKYDLISTWHSDLFVCYHVPSTLTKLYTAYELAFKLDYDNPSLYPEYTAYYRPYLLKDALTPQCLDDFYDEKGNRVGFWHAGGIYEPKDSFTINLDVNFREADQYLLLIDESGREYLSSKYCMNHYYQLDPNRNELFMLNYTMSSTTAVFYLPMKDCKPVLLPQHLNPSIIPLRSPKTRTWVWFDSATPVNPTKLLCLMKELGNRFQDCLLNTSVTSQVYGLPLHHDLMLEFTINPPCSVVDFVPFTPDTVTVHVGSAESISPFSFITHAIMSVLKPVLDFLLDSLLYIFDTLMTIYESPEFVAILDRILKVLMIVVEKLIAFIYDVIWPRILEVFDVLPSRLRYILMITLLFYLRSKKFLWSLLAAVGVVTCFKFDEEKK